MNETVIIRFDDDMLKALDDVLHCRVCKEFYNYCVIAVCGHNFCAHCIRKRMRTTPECPFCFEKLKEADLRNNKLIDKLVRIYEKIRSKSKQDILGNQMEKFLESVCPKIEIADDVECMTDDDNIHMASINHEKCLNSPVKDSNNKEKQARRSGRKRLRNSIESEEDEEVICTSAMDQSSKKRNTERIEDNNAVAELSSREVYLEKKLSLAEQNLKEKDKKISDLNSLITKLKERATTFEKLNLDLTKSLITVINRPTNITCEPVNIVASYGSLVDSNTGKGNNSTELITPNLAVERNESQSSHFHTLEEISDNQEKFANEVAESNNKIIEDTPDLQIISTKRHDFEEFIDKDKFEYIKIKSGRGMKGDSLFVKNLALAMFGEETLLVSSVTGQKCKVKQDAVPKPGLCPKKLNCIKLLFLERLNTENPNMDQVEKYLRFKKINFYINDKIASLLRYRKTC